MAATRSALINVMVRAAHRAARGLVRDFGEVEQLQVSRKGPGDFVSTADHHAEQTVKAELQKARPDIGWLMEETGEVVGKDPTRRWLVDPLDGTTNFLHGLPIFSTSIALEQNGDVVAGIVYNPVSDELFWAEKGQGAYLNDRRLRVSGRRRLADSLLATGIPFIGHEEKVAAFQAEMATLMPQVAGIRRLGSAALDLAYVAAGRFDAFWETGLNPWDVAAGIILVREAGGFVTEIDGRDQPLTGRSILAGNPNLHGLVGRALRDARERGREAATA